MNRNFINLRVQNKIEFDAIITQLDNGSPLSYNQVKKFSGIKNLDLFEKDDKYETPKQSSNSLIDEDSNIKGKIKEC
ncbi:unnamed protein product [Paramecium pentaurelia]|uniref:Uncharacterized protein n=1 Tax=Paramecium pentaurelia TaxID=43138 RepID=A0A8S1T4V8_9CILI|nr:unnamed protein product [Paramecium pentaurelia]